ncbi:MAG: radical SAM protein [Verrucomicrobiota bacterium]|jgi:radical SAM protein with 4Fe4S-binding SPASM domain
MTKRSSAGFTTIAKNFISIAPRPWIGLPLARLELEKRLFNILRPNTDGTAGKIRQASFRITDVCNLRCHTCGQWGDSGYLHGQDLKQLRGGEVTPDRYREIFRDLITHDHRPVLYFWGGEPMLYNGLADLIADAAALRLPSAIATNGTRLKEEAARLVAAPLFLLQVSIDGHNADMHNRCRPHAGGSGDNFGDIVRGLEAVRARRRKLPRIAALTVVSQANLPHLVDIYDAFRDKVDMFVFYMSWWIDEKNAAAHEADFARRFGFRPKKHQGWIGDWKLTNAAELERQFAQLNARSRSWSAPSVSFIPNLRGLDNLRAYYTDHTATFGYKQCVSIHQVIEVNSNGDVSPCRDYHDYVVGNIKTATLTELWNGPAYQKFRQSLSRDGLMPVCRRCCGLMGY